MRNDVCVTSFQAKKVLINWFHEACLNYWRDPYGGSEPDIRGSRISSIIIPHIPGASAVNACLWAGASD